MTGRKASSVSPSLLLMSSIIQRKNSRMFFKGERPIGLNLFYEERKQWLSNLLSVPLLNLPYYQARYPPTEDKEIAALYL